MKNTSLMNRALIFGTILTILIGIPLSQPAHGAVVIAAKYLTPITNGLNAADPAWGMAGQSTVPLDSLIGPTGIPQLLPNSTWWYLQIKAIHDGTDIYFRYEWADEVANDRVDDAPRFADGVAMQIPLSATGNSSIAMGNQFEPVNIIFWRSDLPKPQNIVSGGPGTVQKSPDSQALPVIHSQGWANGRWTVIIKRPMANPSARGNMVSLVRNKSYRIGFAQWDGAEEERDGLKMVSGSWQTLNVQ